MADSTEACDYSFSIFLTIAVVKLMNSIHRLICVTNIAIIFQIKQLVEGFADRPLSISLGEKTDVHTLVT